MSEHKKNHAVAARSGIVVGTGKHHILNAKARVLLLCVLGVVIIAGVVGYVAHYNSGRSNKSNQTHSTAQTPQEQAVGLVATGNPNKALAVLDNTIKSSSSKTTQGALYEQKANIEFSQGNYVASLSAAQTAEKLHPTANSAYWIAANYEQGGDKANALKYYKLTLQRTKARIPSDTDWIIDKIKALGG